MSNGNGRQNGAVGAMTVRERVQHAMEQGKLSQTRLAREVGVSVSTISYYLGGTYRGDNAEIERKLEAWLRAREENRTAQQLVPDAPDFFATQMSAEVMDAFRYAQSIEDMVAIVGAPGTGKTTTCHEYRRQYPNVWLATMAAHTTGVVPVLTEIRDAVGGGAANGATNLAREICRKIRHTGGLLIVDEAHHITVAALDAIRSLHDATGTAIALVGSMELTVKLERMPQLYSRLGVRLHRPRVLAADINALLDAWGITSRAERRALTEVAREPGALRTATKVLRFATAKARAAGEPLTLRHIQDAWTTRGLRLTEEA